MLSEKAIREFSVKYQTSELNVAREYVQHLYLKELYSLEGSGKLAFKGGTALRIVFGSPRFSEDLDFTADIKPYKIRELAEEAAARVIDDNVILKNIESKETTGGYLAIFQADASGYPLRLELNVSTRGRGLKFMTEPHVIVSDLYPAYSLTALSAGQIVREKAMALIQRKKPRDVFDLYYILRSRLGTKEIIAHKKDIVKTLGLFKEDKMSSELKVFLPRSYHNLLPGFVKKIKEQVEGL